MPALVFWAWQSKAVIASPSFWAWQSIFKPFSTPNQSTEQQNNLDFKMPQLDPSTFTSQLFWLAICFGLFYFSMSKIFLPRIRDILQDRNNNINNNRSFALQIQGQTDEINNLSKSLKETSITQYKLSIDRASGEANLYKEKSLSEIKTHIAQMIENSKSEIEQFKKNSQDECQQIINGLVDQIGNKFFNNKIN